MATRARRAKILGIPEDQLPDGRGRHRNGPKGKDHYRWNNDKIISSTGYIKVIVGKDDELSDPNGYAYEHHIIWRCAGNKHPKKGQIIHHKNGNKQDNRIENLELLSQKEHAAKHGAKVFTDQQIMDIRNRFAKGEKMKTIGSDFGVSFQRISKIVKGEVYADVGGPISSTDNRKRGKNGQYE